MCCVGKVCAPFQPAWIESEPLAVIVMSRQHNMYHCPSPLPYSPRRSVITQLSRVHIYTHTDCYCQIVLVAEIFGWLCVRVSCTHG